MLNKTARWLVYFSRWKMITRSYKIHLFVVQRRDIYLNRFRGVFCDQLSMNSVSSGLERFNVIYLSTFSFYHTWTLSSILLILIFRSRPDYFSRFISISFSLRIIEIGMLKDVNILCIRKRYRHTLFRLTSNFRNFL